MANFTLDASSLSNLLTALGPPAFRGAECTVTDSLVVRLTGIRTGITFLGRALGHVDAELAVRARRLGPHAIELTWELGDVAGLPGSLVRTMARTGFVQPLLRKLLAKLRLAAATDVDDHAITIHLDRLPSGRGAVMPLLRCTSFAIPGRRGQAVTGAFVVEASAPSRLAAPSAPPSAPAPKAAKAARPRRA